MLTRPETSRVLRNSFITTHYFSRLKLSCINVLIVIYYNKNSIFSLSNLLHVFALNTYIIHFWNLNKLAISIHGIPTKICIPLNLGKLNVLTKIQRHVHVNIEGDKYLCKNFNLVLGEPNF